MAEVHSSICPLFPLIAVESDLRLFITAYQLECVGSIKSSRRGVEEKMKDVPALILFS